MRLKDKVAIITGAASGIGQATAYLMSREGATVVISDINRQGAEEVAQDIRKFGGRALALKTDIASSELPPSKLGGIQWGFL
jgi:NAD(P)-dependent dehydrogenase (short-subunit alcohol dehydrogenase family)